MGVLYGYDMDAGPALMRSYRKERKISQDKLARLADVSVSAVSQIERGVHGARRDTVERVDRALEARGEILVAFGFTENPTTAAADTSTRLDDLEREVAELRQAVTLLQAHAKTGADRETDATDADTRGDAAPPSAP